MLKCYNTVGQKESMPKETVKKFEDWSKLSSPPFVLYGDIEILLIPPEEKDSSSLCSSSNILQTQTSYVVGSYLIPHATLSSAFFTNNPSQQ